MVAGNDPPWSFNLTAKDRMIMQLYLLRPHRSIYSIRLSLHMPRWLRAPSDRSHLRHSEPFTIQSANRRERVNARSTVSESLASSISRDHHRRVMN